jgi:outer membrane biosynthesis protein TonB
MANDKIFQVALTVSLIGHSLVLIGLPHIELDSKKKDYPQIEVNYFQLRKIPRQSSLQDKRTPESRSLVTEESHKTIQKIQEATSEEEALLKKEPSPAEKRQSPAKAQEQDQKEFPISPEVAQRPEYLSYYQLIREAIKDSAYRNCPLSFTDGEVYISFILLSDGHLKAAKVIDKKSTAGKFLKQIALRSLSNAAPYPPFPKELDLPELSFNIIISFQSGANVNP